MNTNKINFWALFWLILLLTTISIFSKRNAVKTNENSLKRDTICIYKYIQQEKVHWDTFIEALIWVESKGNSNAVGENDDTGVLQITPKYLQQVNKILNDNVYTLEDRKDSLKSVEMFNVIQGYYNPHKDFHLALKLHNPQAPWSYHIKVIKEYKKRLNYVD